MHRAAASLIVALALIAAACSGDGLSLSSKLTPEAAVVPSVPAFDGPAETTATDPTATDPAATDPTDPPNPSTTGAAALRAPAFPGTAITPAVPERQPGTVPGWTLGRPWGSVTGLTMFRGNPTRTYYGEGPAPLAPTVDWRFPDRAMCGESSAGGVTKQWCGSGWTGQPVVWERPDGVTEVIFGAYDKKVHFVDAHTGRRTRPDFVTGDIIKGSVTLDPDGYPLLYFGSRDSKLRILALDRDEPTEIWSLDADVVRGVWNDDWDGNPVIIDDILYEGGENSWFFAIELNREFDDAGMVDVSPRTLLQIPGYTDDLIAKVGRNVSIENSVAVYDTRVYFANSGGRVMGLDMEGVREGNVPIVFDYWVGDDVDATIVVDAAGFLYVSVEKERNTDRAEVVGQLMRLDPYTSGDPHVWGIDIPARGGGDGGMWATPALHRGLLYAATHPGELLVVDIETGEVVWRDEIGWHAWSSPVVVDDTLIVGTCSGTIRGYSLDDPRSPEPAWEAATGTGSCIESTPAVWKGRMYVGSRDGYFYAFGG